VARGRRLLLSLLGIALAWQAALALWQPWQDLD
jgi:hypothetical protein